MREKIDRVLSYEATKKVWRKNRDSVEFKDASFLSYHFFGTYLKSDGKCSCVEDLFTFLHNVTDEFINQKSTKVSENFVLKPNVLLALHGINEQYNNNNLTDEAAIDILTKFPGHKASFATLPENVDQLIRDNKRKIAAAKGKAVKAEGEDDATGEGAGDAGEGDGGEKKPDATEAKKGPAKKAAAKKTAK